MTNHRHCELYGCCEIATVEIAVLRDTHAPRNFGRRYSAIWVCREHETAGLADCATRTMDIGRLQRVKVEVGS